MTENEAIARFKSCQDNFGKCEKCRFYSCCGIYDMEDTAINALEEVQQYSQIGTVEECREAVEKQTAKRPEFVDTRFMNNGKHISDGCQLQKCYKCPNCNKHIFHVWDDELYCKYCGQHIDWRANDGKID